MAARKTAAQKAAEAAERDEYTGTGTAAPEQDANLTDVRDDKGRRLTVQQLKNKLRNEAEREVLDTHKAEVVTITAAKYKVHNLEYVRRLSDEEKAAKDIADRLNQFPELRALFAPVGAAHAEAQHQPPIGGGISEPEIIVGQAGVPIAPPVVGYYPGDEDPDWTEDPEVEAREGE